MISTISKEEYIHIYNIVGACYEVHDIVGRGLTEAIYQELLEIELNMRGIEYEREKKLIMKYKGIELKKEYYADFICKDVIIELKAVDEICSEHRAQLMNYLRITGMKKGVLVNFGEKSLWVERYIYQEDTDDFALLLKSNLSKYVRN